MTFEPTEKNDRDRLVKIEYTNHRGEFAVRTIRPITIFFGHNSWHPDNQWLLEAWDDDRGATRFFAMRGISQWGTKS